MLLDCSTLLQATKDMHMPLWDKEYALGKGFIARWGNLSKFPVVSCCPAFSPHQSVAVLAKLGALLWPGAGDGSWCLGSSPGTCVLLSWAHTHNGAEYSADFDSISRAAGEGAVAERIVCRNVWSDRAWGVHGHGERYSQGCCAWPGTAPSQLFPGSITLPSQPTELQAGCQQRQCFGRFLNADWASVWQAICTIWHPRANPGEGAGQWGGPNLKCHLEVKHQPKWHKAIKPNNERDQGWEGSWRAEDDCALEASQISLPPAVHIHGVLRNAVMLSISIYYKYWNRDLNIYDVFCMHVLLCSGKPNEEKAELCRKMHFWLCLGMGSWCWWCCSHDLYVVETIDLKGGHQLTGQEPWVSAGIDPFGLGKSSRSGPRSSCLWKDVLSFKDQVIVFIYSLVILNKRHRVIVCSLLLGSNG